MCEVIIEDPTFKVLFNKFFKSNIDEATLACIDDIVANTLSTDAAMYVLNIIKASYVSDDDFTTLHQRARQYLDANITGRSRDSLDKFIIAITLKYLISVEASGIEVLLQSKRDFISEVIAEKFKVARADITGEMRSEILNNPNDVYSIDDPPINDWDKYFFNICRQVARNSKCLSRRIGAVLVEDKSIISTGYNGPPRGVPRCDTRWKVDSNFIEKYASKVPEGKELIGICPRYPLGAKSGEMLDLCPAAHAEENAILDAARRGVKTKGATLYMTCGIPCFRCLIKIIQAGVSEIVVTGIKFYDDNSEFLLNNSNVKVRLYNF